MFPQAAEVCQSTDQETLRKGGLHMTTEQVGKKMYETRKFPVVLANGETGVGCFIRDVTEKKDLEAQLLQAQKMEAIGTLAGGVAHDFNNILTAIMGFTSLASIANKENNLNRVDVYLERVLKSSEKAAELTKQLLAFSRKEAIEVKNCSLGKLLAESRKMLGRIIGENIEIEMTIPEEDIQANVDSGKISQTVMNLIVNAKDALPSDGGKIRIGLEKEVVKDDDMRLADECKTGEYACISVSDNGKGISEKIINNIFDPFFTTKDVDKGTGLGLSIAYGIVKQHFGFIDVKSEVGKGTTFRIFLPMEKEEEEKVEDGQEKKPDENYQGKGESILFVEDNCELRNLVETVLSGSGYEIRLAEDANRALSLIGAGERFDLVITDIVMPGGLNGIKFAEIVRSKNPNMKFITTSGYYEKEISQEEIARKGFPFIRKPFGPKELLVMIKEELAR